MMGVTWLAGADTAAFYGYFIEGHVPVERIGESPYKRSFEAMTFKPRTVMR